MEKIKRFKITYHDGRKPIYIQAYSIRFNGDNYIMELRHKDVKEFKFILGRDIKAIKEV